MWYVKKEYMKEVQNSKDFNDCLNTIKRLVKEDNAFTVPLIYGKTTLALQIQLKAIEEGYEFVGFDIG